MTDVFAVAVEGITAFDSIEELNPKVLRAARLAVNYTVRLSRTTAARSMEKQINFPRGYLTGQSGRLTIPKFASDGDLIAILRGRDKPTSLARFVVGGAKPGAKTKGVSVEVDPGIAKYMPSAFAIKLRNGNIGLAYRTKSGKPPKSVGAKKLGDNLWLLYGASVDQVFRDTRSMIKGDMQEHMSKEFQRLLEAGV
jgi:hypothetical protein